MRKSECGKKKGEFRIWKREVGRERRTRRRPIGRDYAATKDAEGGIWKSECGMRKKEGGIWNWEGGRRNDKA